jgi:hypothetical protein
MRVAPFPEQILLRLEANALRVVAPGSLPRRIRQGMKATRMGSGWYGRLKPRMSENGTPLKWRTYAGGGHGAAGRSGPNGSNNTPLNKLMSAMNS